MKKISTAQQSVLAIIAGLLAGAWITHDSLWLVFVGIVALTLPFPVLHNQMHKYWSSLSMVLGFVSRHIILFLLFYLFLTPIAFLMKIFGKKAMLTKLDQEDSAFMVRRHIYTPEDFNNPW